MAEANAGQLGMLFGSHFASPHYNDVTGNFEKRLPSLPHSEPTTGLYTPRR